MLAIAELTDRYKTMTRALNRGAQDGNKNLPTSGEAALSPTELQIVQLAQSDLDKLAVDKKSEYDETWESIRALQSSLPREFPYNINVFRTNAEFNVNEIERELLRAYENVLLRRQEFRYFKTINRLSREPDLPSSKFVAISWLFLVIVADGVFNAYFFKDANSNALLGGFLMAFAISAGNTLFGFAMGLLPWRYLNHRNRLHILWSFPLCVVMFAAIVLFNLAVGHYRELLLSNPDAQAVDIIDKVITSSGLLHTIQSWMLSVVGFGIAMFATYKGYTLFDPYPRYGKCYRRQEDAKNAFEKIVRTMQARINSIAKVHLEEAKKGFQQINKRLQKLSGMIDELISASQSYDVAVAAIEDACNAVLRVYRDANRQVRDEARYPAPVYFDTRCVLQKHVDVYNREALEQAKLEVSTLEKALKLEFENLTRMVPDESRALLSETGLSERLDKVKQSAKRSLQDEGALRD